MPHDRPRDRGSRKKPGGSSLFGLVALLLPAVLVVYGFVRGALKGPKRGSGRPVIGSDTAAEHRPPEKPGVSTGPILVIAAGFMIFVGVCLAGLYYYFQDYVNGPLIQPVSDFPEPPLRFAVSDLARLKAEQRKALTGYAWVDRSQGLLQIPIDRAMEIIASRGAQGLDPLATPARVPEPGSRGGDRP